MALQRKGENMIKFCSLALGLVQKLILKNNYCLHNNKFNMQGLCFDNCETV